jgi:hypothetical protein
MSLNTKFELYKIKREINRIGKRYNFYRKEKNEFGEPIDDEYKPVASIVGIYHEHTAHMFDTYIFNTGEEPGIYRNKKMPQIFCLSQDLYNVNELGEKYCLLNTGDYVDFNGHMAKVTGIRDVMEWNIATDISFEEVDYGSSSGVQEG